jgi:lipopolysaccharide export system permease protein
LVGAINVAFVNPISARLYELHETIKYRFATRNPQAMLFSSKGLWIREAAQDGKVLVIQAKGLRQEAHEKLSMRDISILEMDRNSQILRRVEALVGELKGHVFKLRGVKVFESGQKTTDLDEISYNTTIDLQRIRENFIDPDAISVWDLPDTIHFYESSGFSAVRHKMRYLSLLVSPFLLVAMVLIASLFALKPNMRQGGVIFMIVAGIVTGFVVYFTSQLVYAFGINGYIPVWFAVWSPSLVVMLLAVTAMIHREEG